MRVFLLLLTMIQRGSKNKVSKNIHLSSSQLSEKAELKQKGWTQIWRQWDNLKRKAQEATD